MKCHYGIDAPSIVRNLFLFSLVAAIGMILSFSISNRVGFWIGFLFCTIAFLHLFVTGLGMLYSSLYLKPRLIKNLVSQLQLQGNETLLDVGCGRGMLLIEAAGQLTSGKAYGMDLWSQKDQSNNSLASTTKNINASGFADRIALQTADMRSLPFPDAFFDVVVSSLAIHNITEEQERDCALLEILRVLKSKGKFALLDIQYTKQYTTFLNQTQRANATCSSKIYYCPPIQLVYGEKY